MTSIPGFPAPSASVTENNLQLPQSSKEYLSSYSYFINSAIIMKLVTLIMF